MGDKERREPIVLQPSKLAHKEIVPTPLQERTLGWPSFAAIWFTNAAQMGVFALGASLAEAMPVAQALLAVLIANLGMVVILVLIGDIGIEHGLNFAGYLRAPFGVVGYYLPLALRALAAVAWVGIQTYLGAVAIDVVAMRFFDVSALPLWYLGLGAVQIAIVAGGIGAIRRVINFVAPALALLSVWLLYIMFSQASLEAFLNNPVTEPRPFVVAIVANLSYWSTVAVNLPDFTQHLKGKATANFFGRNSNSIIAQVIGVPIGMLFFTTVGMAGLVFTGESNPVLAIAMLIGGVSLLIALGVVVLAQLTTNVTANLYSSAYAANAIGSPRVSFALGAIITGTIGLLFTFPWILLDFFLTYLPVIGAALAPVAGIMIADYYLIRRRRLTVPHIFDPNGQYRYWRGFNLASYIAWAVGVGAGLALLDYSFLVALPVGLVLYYLLMRYWIVRRYEQSELKATGQEGLATTVGRNWPIRMADSEESHEDEQ